MTRTLIHIALLLLSARLLGAQSEHEPSSSVPAYRNADLGFHYQPPKEMHDKTEASVAVLKEEATHLGIKNSLKLLLSMSSGPDDGAVDWHSLMIVAYPRDAYGQLDDAGAEAKMSNWVGGASESDPAYVRKVIVSGQTFSVSTFSVQADGVKKGSVVWTTIRRHDLLSFAFAANSAEQLRVLSETMKTVQFF